MKRNIKKAFVIAGAVIVAVLAGSTVGVHSQADTNNNLTSVNKNISKYGSIIDSELTKLKTTVYEDDGLIIKETDMDVSGRSFDEIHEIMMREAKENGGIVGE